MVDPAQKGDVMRVPAIGMLSLIAAMVLALFANAEAQSREYFLTGPDTQKYAVIFGGAAADERYRASSTPEDVADRQTA